MNQAATRRPVSYRMLALSVTCGLLVTSITYLCAWRIYGAAVASYENGHLSRLSDLRQLSSLLQAHLELVGHFPDRLEELAIFDEPHVRRNQIGVFIDVDGQEYYYQLNGNGYTLLWLGKDKQIGGEGVNADMTEEGSRFGRPSLWQFMYELHSEGMRFTAILSGVVASLLTFNNSRKILNCKALAVELLVTILVTVIVALFIAVVHIPSGH